jgi:hypothetical protein
LSAIAGILFLGVVSTANTNAQGAGFLTINTAVVRSAGLDAVLRTNGEFQQMVQVEHSAMGFLLAQVPSQ